MVVVGRIRVREWERDGRRGSTTEIHANSVGHDLTRGIANFSRPARKYVAGDAVEEGPSANAGAGRDSVVVGVS